jgi:hypothetical protein
VCSAGTAAASAGQACLRLPLVACFKTCSAATDDQHPYQHPAGLPSPSNNPGGIVWASGTGETLLQAPWNCSSQTLLGFFWLGSCKQMPAEAQQDQVFTGGPSCVNRDAGCLCHACLQALSSTSSAAFVWLLCGSWACLSAGFPSRAPGMCWSARCDQDAGHT